ncbi:hypothetical protein D5301_05665 [Stenotrophomonas sp. MH181796]|nr:hypothetical protein [Stenotrophomonas sp. MH181796]
MGLRCSVDWSAWTVLVALLAIAVAWCGVVVTAASAAAVYWLGRQANAVAAATHQIENEARVREGRFILAYLYSEILDAFSSVDSWLVQANVVSNFYLQMNEQQRREVMEVVRDLALNETERRFDRLHVIEPMVGLRLARALSTIQLLRLAYEPLIRLQNDQDGRTRIEATIAHVTSARDDLKVVLQAGLEARRFVEH